MKKFEFITSPGAVPAAFICVLLVLATVLTPAPARSDVVEGIAAVVDGSVITHSEVREALLQAGASEADEEARKALLETLIERRLVDLEAARLGVVTTQEELEAAVESVRERSGLDKLAFRAELEKSGLNWDEYLVKIKMDMTHGRAFRVAVGSELQLSEESLYDYYLKNAEEFYQSEKIRILHVSMKGDEGLEKLTALREKVVGGVELTAAAQEIAGVAAVDTGFMEPSGINETFRNALKGLEVATPSEIISLSGTHILLFLAERKEAGVTPYEGIREKVRESFIKHGEEKLFRDWIQKLKQNAKIERKS
jgi:peptidyl-prolyl cis-trans isomerase SurA